MQSKDEINATTMQQRETDRIADGGRFKLIMRSFILLLGENTYS